MWIGDGAKNVTFKYKGVNSSFSKPVYSQRHNGIVSNALYAHMMVPIELMW